MCDSNEHPYGKPLHKRIRVFKYLVGTKSLWGQVIKKKDIIIWWKDMEKFDPTVDLVCSQIAFQ